MKNAAAAYLCYLEIGMITDAHRENIGKHHADELLVRLCCQEPVPRGRDHRGAESKNRTVFLVSFIPAICAPRCRKCFLAISVVGSTSLALNTSADLIVTLLAGPLGESDSLFGCFPTAARTATGVIMIGLGTYLATSEK